MTMLKKVAQAIKAVDFATPTYVDTAYEALACAAIKAMREPSDEVLKAVTADRLLPPQYALSATEFWQAMIDAALREGT